jgi:prenyltransferase beta subunit
MRACLAAALMLLFAAPSTPAVPQPPAPEKERVKMDDRTKAAVGRALKWMKDQQASDGSWGNTAITAFALLAYMANGHVPNQGEYGPEVAKGVRYLLACARDDGYLVGPRGGNMYCHGMAALALTQVYGMTGDEEVKKVLKKSIDLIVRTQNNEGGWRYDPAPTGADISVTIMQVMALRGAKDSGIHVPDRCMTEAVRYINRCRDPRSGGYRYQPYSAGPGYARTAAGVCVLQLCGDYEADEIKAAVEYMDRVGEDRQHFWYGHYYAAHALNQVGGKVWEEYYERMRADLLREQLPDGRWYSPRREAAYGPVYQTAIAVLILSVPTHYLPIYQK